MNVILVHQCSVYQFKNASNILVLLYQKIFIYFIPQISSALEKTHNTHEHKVTAKDDISLFTDHLASQLRSIRNPETRLILQNDISQLMFKAMLADFRQGDYSPGRISFTELLSSSF